MRLINWNIERRGPNAWQAASIVSEIAGLDPDLVVLTEAHADSMDRLDGYSLSHPGYNASRKVDSERLVLIWSKAPWEEVPLPTALQENGGAIFGRTEVNGRKVHCLGICIPWHMSPENPPTEKIVPWAQDTRFLQHLKSLMPQVLEHGPLIIAGDFNRFVPRAWGPKASYALLEETFSGTQFLTGGQLAPLDIKTIDHIAVKGLKSSKPVVALSRFETDGRPRSDHFGVLVDLD